MRSWVPSLLVLAVACGAPVEEAKAPEAPEPDGPAAEGEGERPTEGEGEAAQGDGGQVVRPDGGPLAGVEVTVPPGAAPDGVTVSVSPGEDIVLEGSTPLGPAVRLEPGGTVFSGPVVIRLPFDAGRLPDDADLADVVVLKLEEGGDEPLLIAPTGVDDEGGAVVFETWSFSTAQVATVPPGKCVDDGLEDVDDARSLRAPKGDRIGRGGVGQYICPADDDWRVFQLKPRERVAVAAKSWNPPTVEQTLVDGPRPGALAVQGLQSHWPGQGDRLDYLQPASGSGEIYWGVSQKEAQGYKVNGYERWSRVVALGPKPTGACTDTGSTAGRDAASAIWYCGAAKGIPQGDRVCPGEEDWFRTLIPGGGELTIDVFYDMADGEPEVDGFVGGQLLAPAAVRRVHIGPPTSWGPGDLLGTTWRAPMALPLEVDVRIRSRADWDGGKPGVTYVRKLGGSGVQRTTVARDDAVITAEDTPFDIDVLGNDSPAGCPITVKSLDTSQLQDANSVAIQAGKTVRYTPPSDWSGTDRFDYTLEDSAGDTATATVTVTVTPLNDSPVANDELVVTDEDTFLAIDVLANDSDAETPRDSLQIVVVSVDEAARGASAARFYPMGRTREHLAYRPPPNWSGSDVITYRVLDKNNPQATSNEAEAVVTVRPVADDPIAVDDSYVMNEDAGATELIVLANDSDPDGDAFDVSAVGAAGKGSTRIVAGGGPGGSATIEYTPGADEHGADSFEYTISDGNGGTDTALVRITLTEVDDPPVASDSAANVRVGQSVDATLLIDHPDPPPDTLTLSVVTPAAKGRHTFERGGTVLRYTPNANATGTDTVVYRAADQRGGADTATVTITIAGGNGAPVANPDRAQTAEDTPVTIDPKVNDTDPDLHSITVTDVAHAGNAIQPRPNLGIASVTAGGDVRYEPLANRHGVDTVGYVISDGFGGTATGVIEVTITPVDDPPIAAPDGPVGLDEDGRVEIDVVANDHEPDGQPILLISATNGTIGSARVMVNAQGDAVVEYRPDADRNGPDQFDYRVEDPGGAGSTGTVRVEIRAINDAPEAITDRVDVDPAAPPNIRPLANDLDPDGDRLSISAFGQGADGTVQRGPAGVLIYSPRVGFAGADRFTYEVSDGNGEVDQGVVIVNVLAQQLRQHNPVANDDDLTVAEDSLGAIGVLANDTDEDGDRLTVTDFSQGEHGQVVVGADGAARYQPEANWSGQDAFTYTIDDGTDRTASATVNVTVQARPDPPVAVDDEADADGAGGARIAVLDNDSDPDGDELSLGRVFGAEHGVTDTERDLVIYQADAGYSGQDRFVYEVLDGTGEVAMAVVVVTVPEPACVPADGGEACDGNDGDCDGLVDCDDDDCAAEPACAVDCEAFGLGNGLGRDQWFGSTQGRADHLDGACGADGNADDAAIWDAPYAGTFGFLIAAGAATSDPVLYVRDGDCGGAELACVAPAEPGGATYAELDLANNQRVTLLVEAQEAGGSTDFSLTIQALGEDCDQFGDEDGDGMIDCEDPECEGVPPC